MKAVKEFYWPQPVEKPEEPNNPYDYWAEVEALGYRDPLDVLDDEVDEAYLKSFMDAEDDAWVEHLSNEHPECETYNEPKCDIDECVGGYNPNAR